MKTLAKKLVAILSETNSIPKAGWNEFHKYAYHKEEDVSVALKKLFVSHGVFVSTSVVESTITPHTSAKGKPMLMAKVRLEHVFMCIDSGETHTVYSVGTGDDEGDKGIYKALTGANKYFLMKNFMLSEHNDPENESSDSRSSIDEPMASTADTVAYDPTYVVGFGKKYKGKRLSEMSTSDIEGFAIYLVDGAKKDNKPLNGEAKKFVEQARMYLDSLPKQNSFNEGDILY